MSKPSLSERVTELDALKAAQALGFDFKGIGLSDGDWVAAVRTELEHGMYNEEGDPQPDIDVTHDDVVATAKIAIAHLRESSKYYDKSVGLPAMEEALEKEDKTKNEATKFPQMSSNELQPQNPNEPNSVKVDTGPQFSTSIPMSPDEYQVKSMRTLNPDLNSRDTLMELCLGLAGESGELIDLLKKILFHGWDTDASKIKSEAGDLLWYLSNILATHGISLSETMTYNIDKLKERYPDKYDSDRSVNRKENQEEFSPDSLYTAMKGKGF